MTEKERLRQISLSLEKFQRTGDVEHLEDIERILNEEILGITFGRTDDILSILSIRRKAEDYRKMESL